MARQVHFRALIPDLGLDGIVLYAIDSDRLSITQHGFAASVPGGGLRHIVFPVTAASFTCPKNSASPCRSFAGIPPPEIPPIKKVRWVCIMWNAGYSRATSND